MKVHIFKLILFLFCIVSPPLSFARSGVIPTIAISTIPVVQVDDISNGRKEFIVLNTISAKAVVHLDYSKTSHTITEDSNEFYIEYKLEKENTDWYWDCKNCEGIIRLGYLGGTSVYPDNSYISATETVRRLALYRIIGLAKEYGADALLVPTITTTATSQKNIIMYTSEVTAKIVKIKND